MVTLISLWLFLSTDILKGPPGSAVLREIKKCVPRLGGTAKLGSTIVAVKAKGEEKMQGSMTLRGCPPFWHVRATQEEEELSWVTH